MVHLTPDHPHLNMRIRFKKVGSLQYVSHLDLVRTMHKIIVRAGLPLWYTEGFNPKPKMIFAAPLSIGTESVCEFMDVKLIDDMPAEEVMRRLNENMTDEMQVLEAYYTDVKLTELKWLGYTVKIGTLGASPELAEDIVSTLSSDVLEVEKKGKPNDKPKTVDIRPLIRSACAEYTDGVIELKCVLSADASAFLNPEYVIKALKDKLGILSCPDLTKEYYTILRTDAFKGDMTPFA